MKETKHRKYGRRSKAVTVKLLRADCGLTEHNAISTLNCKMPIEVLKESGEQRVETIAHGAFDEGQGHIAPYFICRPPLLGFSIS